MKPLSSPRPPEEGGGLLADATWLYSYADLMTQLLLFAILTVALSGMGKPEQPGAAPANPMDQTARDLDRLVRDAKLEGALSVDRGADRLVIRLKSAVLFREGQAALTPQADRVLSEVVPLLARTKGHIRVEGHTDDVPIHSAAFPSNWELSSARAISVEQYLEQHGIAPSRLSVAGYGEHHPIVPNQSAEQRAMNRRVELVVLE